jgi:16S rRNA (adenine1518-N6/adenine1519-N6)-dimethyltransferase
MARQRLGQHFLADANWREQIARAIGVSPQATLRSPAVDRVPAQEATYGWIEVGAGHGEMTECLASTGAAVYAIELDALLLARLRKLAKRFPNLTVVHGDVLESDLAALAAGRRIRLYGNLPYYITSPILRHLFAAADRIRSIDIVIQFEVAARIAAPPGRRAHGYLSALCQFYAKPEIVLRIPPGAFRPPPEVTSALVSMTMPGERATLDIADEPRFLEFLQRCFGQKRKTLRNNLRGLASATEIEAALQKCRIPPTARAEELTLAQFAAMYDAMGKT